MRRRTLLNAGCLAPFALGLNARSDVVGAAEPGRDFEWRRFEVTTQVTLPSTPGWARLWLPVAQTASEYQVSLDLQWQGNGSTRLAHDARYGAGVIVCAWDATTQSRQLQTVQIVATRDREEGQSLVPLTQAERDFWTAPTRSVPTDGIVREMAEKIVAGTDSPRARVRAIYDWVVENTWRDPETRGCGTGDIKTMLETGTFGGKCADINGLMVALSRGAGFPARDVYGIRVANSRLFPSLGRSGNISKAQHCRAEVFLDDTGWFPIDPADVRKVVLEEKLSLDTPKMHALRDKLFGTWEMNWIAYNSAVDIELPQAGKETPNFSFLMYPCAFTPDGQPDCLDPARFQYEITARELT